jgi:hypothetical protein
MPAPPEDGAAVIELEAWNQIRRTEGEAIEIGTIDKTLLHDHGVGLEAAGRIVTALAVTARDPDGQPPPASVAVPATIWRMADT